LSFGSPAGFKPDRCGVWVYFCTCDPNPTHIESGLGANFIFHPRVHPKKKNLKPKRKLKKPPKNSKLKKPEPPERNSFTKPDEHPNPIRNPTDSTLSVKLNPTIFFHGLDFRSTRPDPLPSLISVGSCGFFNVYHLLRGLVVDRDFFSCVLGRIEATTATGRSWSLRVALYDFQILQGVICNLSEMFCELF
jgi:hypothetical protein